MPTLTVRCRLLRKADDAILLDNSELTIDEQREWLLEKFKGT